MAQWAKCICSWACWGSLRAGPQQATGDPQHPGLALPWWKMIVEDDSDCDHSGTPNPHAHAQAQARGEEQGPGTESPRPCQEVLDSCLQASASSRSASVSTIRSQPQILVLQRHPLPSFLFLSLSLSLSFSLSFSLFLSLFLAISASFLCIPQSPCLSPTR